MTEIIKIEENYLATPEKIWAAITNKEQMKQWYFDIPDFELKIGTTFNFYEPGDKKEYHHRCTIKEIVPNKKLSHTWTHPSHSKGESLLTWEIVAKGNKTTVTLIHQGIETFKDAGKDFVKENYEIGWKENLSKLLKEFLEN